MKRSGLKTWAGFALVILGMGCGLAWLSSILLQFERERREAEGRERLAGKLRLAVWRIDSLMAPVLAEEAARPPAQYEAFYPLLRSYTAKGSENKSREILVPSPILKPSSDWAILNFQVDSKGEWSSPQVPSEHLLPQAIQNGVNPVHVERQKERLKSLSESIEREELEHRLTDALASRSESMSNNWFLSNALVPLLPNQNLVQQEIQTDQKQTALEDFSARQRALNRFAGQQSLANLFEVPRVENAKVSRLVPLWFPSHGPSPPSLALVRRVEAEQGIRIQGVLVDWLKLKSMAEAEVKDLFPQAELKPSNAGPPADPDRTLAVLPAELNPGAHPTGIEKSYLTPVRAGILLIWIAFLSGAAAVGAGLRSLLALNRRRLDFVSAVTHELRTPLTTFSIYTEMLKEGMVPKGQEREYYSTLYEESLRVSHLVENVLDYSRLESRSITPKRRKASLKEHLERILPVLQKRCARKNIPFLFHPSIPLETVATLDSSALGQILYNLVDNACKYGDGEVKLSLDLLGERIFFEVSDRGPGIDPWEGRRVFSPFYRGRAGAARGSGVGLGLALCKRWAKEMGGDLRLEKGPGARFVLGLPLQGSGKN